MQRSRPAPAPATATAFCLAVAAALTALLSGIGPLAQRASAQSAKAGAASIPDEWFFSGENRPAQLRELEGKPAPDLEVESWIGDAVKLSEQRGKVVVVDFWATWCGPCMASIPENVALVDAHAKDGLVFVGVHDSNSGFDRAPQTVKEKKINYPVAKDASGGKSALAYRVQFWPTYIVIDRDGTVRAAGLMPQHVAKVVEMLLEEAPPAAGAGGLAPENYLGGAKRPASLREAEGRIAAKLAPGSWIGAEPAANWRDSWRNAVVALHFTQPSGNLAAKELERFARLADEFSGQGVVFAVIGDPHADAAALKAMADAAKATMPFAHDALPAAAVGAEPARAPAADAPLPGTAAPAPKPAGEMAAACGVAFMPVTVIIDRTGRIRAAGVRLDRAKPLLDTLLAEALPAPAAATSN